MPGVFRDLRDSELPEEEPGNEALAPDEPTRCAHPGRRGCGRCEACADWGDAEYHRMKEER